MAVVTRVAERGLEARQGLEEEAVRSAGGCSRSHAQALIQLKWNA